MNLWKVTVHCRGSEGDWELSGDVGGRFVLGDATLIVRVLSGISFSATVQLPATSGLIAIVEAAMLMNRELPQMNMPDWPAVEICGEPVEVSAATQAYGATGCT